MSASAIAIAVEVGIPVAKAILDYATSNDIELTDEQIEELSKIRDMEIKELEDLINEMPDEDEDS